MKNKTRSRLNSDLIKEDEFQFLYAGETVEDIGSEGMVKLMNGKSIKAKNLLDPDLKVGTSVIVLKDKKTKQDYIYTADI